MRVGKPLPGALTSLCVVNRGARAILELRTFEVAGSAGTTVPVPRAGLDRTLVSVAADSVSLGRHSPPPWVRRYIGAAMLVDLCAALLSCAAASLVRPEPAQAATGVLLGMAFPFAWLLLVQLSRGYHGGELGAGGEEFRGLLRAALLVLAGISVLSYALDLDVSRGLVLVAVPGTVFLSAVGRYALRRRVHALRSRGRCMRSVVAVGRERAVLDLVRQLRQEPHCGMEVVAACVPDPDGAELLRTAGIETIADLNSVAATVAVTGAGAVAVTSSSETAASFSRRLSWELEGAGVELLVAPGVTEVAGPRMHLRPFIGLPLLHVEQPEFSGPKRLVKGAIDRVAAGLIVLLLSPALVLTAVAVRLDSAGPVFFRQIRIGRDGREFSMIKFRTMVVDAERRREELLGSNRNADGLLFKIANDPRITRVGRLLRRFSIDELPQLINVLAGQMSLVGPRPPLPAEVAHYDDTVRRRLLVKPGLTGLWQVSGRSDLSWDDAVRLDLRYVENWSLLLDATILWKTFSAVVRARGAY